MLTRCEALLESGATIGVEAWRGAKARDAANAMTLLRPWRAAKIAPRRFLSPAHCAAAMAELMALRAAIDGSCDERDLRCAGFSASDIALHLGAAQVMAAAIGADRCVT